MPKNRGDSAFMSAFTHSISRHTIFRRQTLHCAIYQFARTGETNTLNRTFNQIKSDDDAKVIFEPSANGYNLLHDIIRLSPNDEIEDRYNILRHRLKEVFRKHKMPHGFHELLCHRAENNISVLSSAVNTGNSAIVSRLVYDIEDYCKPAQLLQELKLFEVTRKNGSLSLFAKALYFYRADDGYKAFTEQNVRVFRFLLRKLRKLASSEADPFVLSCIENSEWNTLLVCNAEGTSKEKVDAFVGKYIDKVTQKEGVDLSKRRYLAAMPDAVSSQEVLLDENQISVKRQRMSRWDQPAVISQSSSSSSLS